MSARAIRRLRQARNLTIEADLCNANEEEEHYNEAGSNSDDDDIDDNDLDRKPKFSTFAMMEESSSSEEEEEEEEGEEESTAKGPERVTQLRRNTDDLDFSEARSPAFKNHNESAEEQEEEDIDAILAEFQDEDPIKVDDSEVVISYFQVILDGLDDRDLDFESVMRNNFLGTSNEESSSSNRRSRRRAFLFGQPKDGWARPPHFVGGGIGMKTHADIQQPVPWPYTSVGNDELEGLKNPSCWLSFVMSDTYKNDLIQYNLIQQSGDVNTLAAFVIGNPYVPEALLQLSRVVYQTNQNAEALALLRRALWVYECSASKSLLSQSSSTFLMDCDQKENLPFFQALFLMMQVSSIAGCITTSFAIARFLLAMDPLRDPMSVLVILDFFALSTNTTANDLFVIHLVEGNDVKLYHQDSESAEFVGRLLDMPNWAYSYAMALYRIEHSDTPIRAETIGAKDALVSAIRNYPQIVEELLRNNDISTTGRSTYTDWFPVLESLRRLSTRPCGQPGYDPILYYATKSASDVISNVFAKRSFKLWGGKGIQKWLYDACIEVVSGVARDVQPPSPALQRYARIDPTDFEDRFRHLPAEANPLDPSLLAMSVVINPNRRQLLRRGDRAANHHMDALEALEHRAQAVPDGFIIGGPPMNHIDPDSPLLEVLWQSMLPWNRVDGVPPPRP